jgi:hypothetical protein
MRMMFREGAKPSSLPGNHLYDEQAGIQSGDVSVDVHDVIQKMRYPRGTSGEEEGGMSGIKQPLSDAPVGEQRPSVSAEPVQRVQPPLYNPADAGGTQARAADSGALFTREQPLRQSSIRKQSEPVGAEPAGTSQAAKDLISRFRK